MKKIIALLAALVLTLSLTSALADTVTIAVPNDPTNEGRALNILQDAGVLVNLDQSVSLQEQQGAAFVGGVVGDGNLDTVSQGSGQGQGQYQGNDQGNNLFHGNISSHYFII